MMSARHWRECRSFWRAFVFWAWLASFIFGFAASDLLHAPDCPEELALRAASRSDAASGPTAMRVSASRALHVDAGCATCLLQMGALGVVLPVLIWALPLLGAPTFAAQRSTRAVARPLIRSARGPPVSFI